ncbi:MAG: barstar family protein [Clostridia bacterium]|nr:barstar family protein [Clostridia bacterium]
MKIILNLKQAQTPMEAQEYLKRALAFPDYYGKNLDALYDMLTAWDQPVSFVLRLPEGGDMGAYAQKLRRVFEDAAAENKRISVL